MPSRALPMTKFNGWSADLCQARHNVGTHVYKAMVLTVIPAANDPTNTDYSPNEVSGPNYTAGGIDLEVSLGGGSNTNVDAESILQTAIDTLWAEHATGFEGAKSVVVRNVTTGRNVGFGDITVDTGTTPVSSRDGSVDVNWANGSDIISVT